MKSIRFGSIPVWDLPVRLVHWSLVALLALSWWTAETGRDSIHFWSGYAILFLLLFRIIWGLAGSSTARFANFIRGPSAVLRYLSGGWKQPHSGHSPLGALSVVALLLLLLVQVGLGLIQTDDDGLLFGPLAHLVSPALSEQAHDLHDSNFDLLLILVGIHIAAVLFYRFVLGIRLIGPMVSGRAEARQGIEAMRPVPARRAIIAMVAAIALTAWIIAGMPPLG